jgi:hypothetical protein
VRALERQFERSSPSPLALRELATALSYWAGTYLELPGRAVLRGDLALDEALRRVPRPDQAWSAIEAAQFTRLGELAGFPEAVAALAPPASVDQALSDLTAAFARTMATRDVNPIGLVHAVTPVAGTRVLLPYLPDEVHAEVFAGLWHVSAALTAGMVPPDPRGPARDADSGTEADGREGAHEGEGTAEAAGDPAPMTADELAARAAAHQDPHAVKYAAACLSEHSLRPDPHYLRAAQRAIERIPGW